MPTRVQHARHFGEETREVTVPVQGFDFDNRVEGLVGKGRFPALPCTKSRPGRLCRFRQNSISAGFKSSPMWEAGRKVRTRYEAPPRPQLTSRTRLPLRSTWVAVRW